MPDLLPKTYVCLVSDLAAANLLPLLDPNFAPKHVVLVVSDRMTNVAKSLEEALALLPYRITSERWLLPDAYDVSAMESSLFDHFAELDNQKTQIVVNLTGGTKLMAIVMQRQCECADCDYFYLNYESGAVHYFRPRGSGVEEIRLEVRNPLKPYVRAYGFRLQEAKRSPAFTSEHQQLAHDLIHIASFREALPTLNYCAGEAKNHPQRMAKLPANRTSGLDALIDRLSDNNLLRPKGADQVVFTDEPSRFFVNGGWLEDFVASSLGKLALPGLIVQANPTIEFCEGHEKKRDIAGTHNELDVVAWYRNRLYLFECKTKDYKEEKDDINDTLYKLRQLAQALGSSVKAVLVSYLPIPDKGRQRAKDMGVELIAGNDLKRPDEAFRKIFQPKGH